MAGSGYLRVEWTNLCYTDLFLNKHTLPVDSWYAVSVGTDKKWYIWLDDSDLLRIYYVDELWAKRRTDVSESAWGNVWSSRKWYMWVWNDGYLYFIWPNWDKRRIIWTSTPIPTSDYLWFTANVANSTIALNYATYGGTTTPPAGIEFEISYDGSNRSTYSISSSWVWTRITLNSIGDSVFFRNKSDTVVTSFSDNTNYRNFGMTGEILGSWDVDYLLCKNSTTTLPGSDTFFGLFEYCSSLKIPPRLPATTLSFGCYNQMFYESWITTPPELNATTLTSSCYYRMFQGCDYLTALPQLPATNLPSLCYYYMFMWCYNIKLSETQTWEYQTPYRIPTTWTWTTWINSLLDMFYLTSWTFAGTPNINQTYYTSNIVI